MTIVQIGATLWISVLVAIFHTRIHERWAAFVRKRVEANFEIYKCNLEIARAQLVILAELSEQGKLNTKGWGKGSTYYVESCKSSIENCCGIVKTISGYLSQNDHYFTLNARRHLKNFTEHLSNKIREMDEAIRTAG